MRTEPALLRIELMNDRPVDAADFAAALAALSDEYREFVAEECAGVVATDVRLHVSKMTSGSIISDLVALAPLALPFMENTNTVVDFANHLKLITQALLSRSHDKELSPRSLGNVVNLVEPVAKDNAAQLNVQTVVHNQTINNYFTVNSIEANAIQNAARVRLETVAAPVTGLHRNVVLYLHQARNDPKSRAGDRARIESIHAGSVKLVFSDGGLKEAILSGDENPFKYAYVVDVEVETVRGRPALYKVTAVHERLDVTDAA